MTDLSEEAPKARALGFALLDANRVYEDFVIPSFEGRLRRRPFPPHRRAIIGLVGRQRRFLRATYTLADSEPFSSCFGLVSLQYEDGFGDLSGAAGAAA